MLCPHYKILHQKQVEGNVIYISENVMYLEFSQYEKLEKPLILNIFFVNVFSFFKFYVMYYKNPSKEEIILEHAKVLIPGTRLFEDLYFCGGGRSVCMPGHNFGPDVRFHYLIHYIISGKGIFETDQLRYPLCQGQGFLIEPGVSTFYQADTETPWSYLWISFHGHLAGQIVRDLNIGGKHPVFSCKNGRALENILDRLLAAPDSGSSLYQHSQLMAFFHVLAGRPDARQKMDGFGNRSNYYIDKAVNFIQANYSNPLKISDIANYLGISRNYLFSLFKEHMGQSPQEYLSHFRLGCARELLTTTACSIGEVALLCGYKNSGIFASAFKRKYQMSPSLYQKCSQEHPETNPTEFMHSSLNSAK